MLNIGYFHFERLRLCVRADGFLSHPTMNGVNSLCYYLYPPYYIIPTGSFVGGAVG